MEQYQRAGLKHVNHMMWLGWKSYDVINTKEQTVFEAIMNAFVGENM